MGRTAVLGPCRDAAAKSWSQAPDTLGQVLPLKWNLGSWPRGVGPVGGPGLLLGLGKGAKSPGDKHSPGTWATDTDMQAWHPLQQEMQPPGRWEAKPRRFHSNSRGHQWGISGNKAFHEHDGSMALTLEVAHFESNSNPFPKDTSKFSRPAPRGLRPG